MTMTNEQIAFVNDLADRLEAAESSLELVGGLSEQLDAVNDLAKNFDFGSEIAEIKQVLGQVVGFLGLDLGEQGAAAVTAEGGVEKGNTVIDLGEHSDARKKQGMNFAADQMPVPGNPGAKEVPTGGGSAPGTVLNPKSLSKSAGGEVTLLGALTAISKRLEALEGQGGGRTSGETTGEPVQKRATERPLFQGRF